MKLPNLRLLLKSKVFRVLIFILIAILLWPLPQKKLDYSASLYFKDGSLASTTVSNQGQWHLPYDGELPKNIENAIITYEDEYFNYHPGVNPIALWHAFVFNISNKNRKRGGSTIAMQVMRMRHNGKRNIWNKIYETTSAVKYSLINSKKEVLKEWADRASFGGNTVGIYTSALRYFDRPLDQLSWAECALLAVLPNSPSAAHLGKNRNKLLAKRNFLLQKLAKKGFFEASNLPLYQAEDLPTIISELPDEGYHLLTHLTNLHPNQRIFQTTIDATLQTKLNDILTEAQMEYSQQDINHICGSIIDVNTNEVLAYVGNTKASNKFNYLDLIQRPRSYGSLLKPLLYGYALQTNQLLPNELVADVPTNIGDYRPENFDKKYRGVAPFEDIIIKSLNVPSVRILNYIGMEKFYSQIEKLQLKHLNRGVEHYGLSLILGGGETTPWEISRLYKGLARNYLGQKQPYGSVKILKNEVAKENTFQLSPYAIKHTISAMADLTRPREDQWWSLLTSNTKIAWKTGTSYGHRDAWAAGFNAKYQVTVWIGNADGSSRSGLTGIEKAAPILFKIFNSLPENAWFATPPRLNNPNSIRVCKQSGALASIHCPSEKTQIEGSGYSLRSCTLHKLLGQDTLFILPPEQAYYFAQSNIDYQSPKSLVQNPISIIYPMQNIKIYQPLADIDRGLNPVILRAYHQDENATLFWYLNGKYVDKTKDKNHQISKVLKPGTYSMTVMDDVGFEVTTGFEVLEK